MSCLSEVFYWPIRDDIQRFCIEKEAMGVNVSLTKNAKTVAILVGFLFSGIGLYFNPLMTLIVAAFGMLSSYVPLKMISLEKIKRFDEGFVEKFFSFRYKVSLFKKYSELRNYVFICGISELINGVVPILIVFYGASLLELGIVLTFVQFLSLGYYYMAGRFEDRHNNFIYDKSIIILGISLLVFAYLDFVYLSVLLLVFSIFGVSIEIGITSRLQKKIGEEFRLADSGFVLVWASNFGRCLALVVIPVIYFFNFSSLFHSLVLIFTFFILSLIYFSNERVEKE